MEDQKRGPGRPKGSKNKTKEKKSLRELFSSSSKLYTEVSINKARQFAAKIIESNEYQNQLIRRAKAGVLAPALEMMLWYYLFGKPLERIDVSVSTDDLVSLTDAELVERTRELEKIATEVMIKNQEIEEPTSDLVN